MLNFCLCGFLVEFRNTVTTKMTYGNLKVYGKYCMVISKWSVFNLADGCVLAFSLQFWTVSFSAFLLSRLSSGFWAFSFFAQDNSALFVGCGLSAICVKNSVHAFLGKTFFKISHKTLSHRCYITVGFSEFFVIIKLVIIKLVCVLLWSSPGSFTCWHMLYHWGIYLDP